MRRAAVALPVSNDEIAAGLMRARDVCKLLAIGATEIREMRLRGEIAYVRIGKNERGYRYYRTSVEQFLRARSVIPKGAA
jgi:phage antirepressor YoqD-like protein